MRNGLSGKPWFRLYSEFVSDPKVQLLAFEDQRHFIAILCLKCNETLDSAAGLILPVPWRQKGDCQKSD